ncbi:DUF2239 family protein [Novosphingobium humi]|nr:DUF2239 family protein [Novosphingobium humi]WJS97777.1 DUF2239 family protein [Novosphingobium humi]
MVAREVTLLPRHWDWLAQQPGGASQALRRLIDQARKGMKGAPLHVWPTSGPIASCRRWRATIPALRGFTRALRA